MITVVGMKRDDEFTNRTTLEIRERYNMPTNGDQDIHHAQ